MSNLVFSKSKFLTFVGCNKRLWLEIYKPEEKEKQEISSQLLKGIEVGHLARLLFGDYYLAETNPMNIAVQISNTKEAMKRKEKVICEAAFNHDDAYCAVDILVRNDDDTFSIYEVKSAANIDNSYYWDIAYQNYVLEKCGVSIKSINLVMVNNEYVFDGTLDIYKLFKIIDLSERTKNKYQEVDQLICEARNICGSSNEPKTELSSTCNKHDGCPFERYCHKTLGLPENNSILELYNKKGKSKYELANEGILSFADALNSGMDFTEIQKRQIQFALSNKNDDYVDLSNISKLLKQHVYPLHFFDFESYNVPIPNVRLSRPYQQIPFQYSLHILNEDGTLIHKEFFGDGVNDPRPELINKMIADLGNRGTVIAFNDSFEKTIINQLIQYSPDKEKGLQLILNRFFDLADIFQKGYYYNRRMGGSFSIKSVLPALFPDDPDLNYQNLDQVHKGDEASAAYLSLKELQPDERNVLRNNMLKYCSLDTYAMVKIYLKLMDLVNKGN